VIGGLPSQSFGTLAVIAHLPYKHQAVQGIGAAVAGRAESEMVDPL
jgi:hypothetical protein